MGSINNNNFTLDNSDFTVSQDDLILNAGNNSDVIVKAGNHSFDLLKNEGGELKTHLKYLTVNNKTIDLSKIKGFLTKLKEACTNIKLYGDSETVPFWTCPYSGYYSIKKSTISGAYQVNADSNSTDGTVYTSASSITRYLEVGNVIRVLSGYYGETSLTINLIGGIEGASDTKSLDLVLFKEVEYTPKNSSEDIYETTIDASSIKNGGSITVYGSAGEKGNNGTTYSAGSGGYGGYKTTAVLTYANGRTETITGEGGGGGGGGSIAPRYPYREVYSNNSCSILYTGYGEPGTAGAGGYGSKSTSMFKEPLKSIKITFQRFSNGMGETGNADYDYDEADNAGGAGGCSTDGNAGNPGKNGTIGKLATQTLGSNYSDTNGYSVTDTSCNVREIEKSVGGSGGVGGNANLSSKTKTGAEKPKVEIYYYV